MFNGSVSEFFVTGIKEMPALNSSGGNFGRKNCSALGLRTI
jgi:hypothetical protein